MERLVVEQKGAGYDLIKTHGDFSREAFHRLFVVARREGMKVIGHAPRNLGVEAMFDEHMDAVAHSEEFLYAYFFFGVPDLSQADPATRRQFMETAQTRIPALAAATAKAGIWVIPNLVAYKMIVDQGKDLSAVLARPENEGRAAGRSGRMAAGTQPLRPQILTRDGRADDVAAGNAFETTGAFRQAGVRMMAGTERLFRASCLASRCTTS